MRRLLLRGVARGLLWWTAFAAAFLIVSHGGAVTMRFRHDPPVPPSTSLVVAHDCWTGKAPADVTIPGHVVVTLPTGEVRYGGERLVSKALRQLFDGEHHGLTVHAFCR